MKVRAEYTIYKSMEIEIPKALSEAYYKAVANDRSSEEADNAYDDISDFVGAYVKAEEGDDNLDCVIDWYKIES